MAQAYEHMRVRIADGVCKAVGRRCFAGLALTLSALGCGPAPRTHEVSLRALRQAPPARLDRHARAWGRDADALRGICQPLGKRCGLLQIRTAADYARVANSLALPPERPDFNQGTLVALVSWAGTPCSGHKPVGIESLQMVDGGGLLHADFEGGTYHPDGAVFAETAFVPGLIAVLVVDLGGSTFFP